MAVYVCSKCLFCFERLGNADICPDCGRGNIREATENEVLEFKKTHADVKKMYKTPS